MSLIATVMMWPEIKRYLNMRQMEKGNIMKTPKIIADHAPAVREIRVVWMTTGLGCDGDSVSITAATQPSIEDIVMGAIPGLPKVHLHNPGLACETGEDFMKFWYQATAGKLEPFLPAPEGSVPNENIKWKVIGLARHRRIVDMLSGEQLPRIC